MWVIYNASTGNEIDRIEDHSEAQAKLEWLQVTDDWGYTYGKRWED
jgi:hypothetical protein